MGLGRLVDWLFARIDYYIIRSPTLRLYVTRAPGPQPARIGFGDRADALRFDESGEAALFALTRGLASYDLIAVHKDGRESVVPW